MAQQRNYGGVYANMDFGPRVWVEYPKHICTGPNGQYEVANNLEEEQVIVARIRKEGGEVPVHVAPHIQDPEKEILMSRARELEVPFNPKWSKAKLKQIVQQAELDIDNLPPEESTKTRVEEQPKEEEIVEEESETGISQDELKDQLIAEAKELGIPANRLWGIPRLKSSIAEAKA